MGVVPVPKLLFQMSLPMILSMLVQALYNVVDSIFVAQINENALTAVSLVFPVQSLMISIAVGTGVGVNAVLSRSLGERDGRIIVGSVFQALGNGVYSLIISATRQLLIILPAAAILAKVGGLSAVWWSIPIAEIASVVLSAYFYRKIYREKIASLGKNKR